VKHVWEEFMEDYPQYAYIDREKVLKAFYFYIKGYGELCEEAIFVSKKELKERRD
jgi:hypothetical protein